MHGKNTQQSREYDVPSEYITPSFIGVGALIGGMLGLISNGRYVLDFACCAIVLIMSASLYLRRQDLAVFSVRIQGDQICVMAEDHNRPIIGFFTTHFVTAHSSDEAVEKVKSLLVKDWTNGRHAAINLNRSSAPRLAVIETSKASLLTWLMARTGGYSLYAQGNEEL